MTAACRVHVRHCRVLRCRARRNGRRAWRETGCWARLLTARM